MNQLKLVIVLFLIFLMGCALEFRSPIVINKQTPKEEEKTRPPRKKIVPPPPLTTSKTTEKLPEQAIPSEEPKIPDEFLAEIPEDGLESEAVEAISPKDKPTVSAAKNIVILSPEYLKNTEYQVIEKITVKDVSQTGFNKKEAREALQFEAYRRFGSQAKGIVNITYGGKAGFVPGSARFSEVGGEVITWQGEAPPAKEEKEEVIEKGKEIKTEPEPAKETEPAPPAPDIKTETEVPSPAPSAPSPQTEPQTEIKPPVPVPDTQTKPEPPPPPPAPTITEQQLEN